MRSAVLRESGATRPYAASRPLELADVTLRAPRAGELLVRIERASLCHSDLSVVDGNRPRPLPMALGHEAAGVVVEVGDVGPDAPGFRVGDHVVLVFVPSCGDCRFCASGQPALCEPAVEANGAGLLLGGSSALSEADGSALFHHLGVSAFAEYAVVAASSAVRIDDDVPFDVAALFGCAALTGMGAVLHSAQLRSGAAVVVFGLGAVGLAAVMAAALREPRAVIAIDPNREKHPLALQAGATAVSTPDDLAALLADAGCAGGADVAIEAVGSARVMEAAFAAVGRGGTVVSVGLPHPDQQVTLPALAFAGQGKRLVGSYMGDALPADDIPAYVALWREGRLPIEVLHTDTVDLEDVNEALDALADGHVVRRLFRMPHGSDEGVS